MTTIVAGRGHPAFAGTTKLGIDAPGRRHHNEGHFLFVLLKDTQSEVLKGFPLVGGRTCARLSRPAQQDRGAPGGAGVGGAPATCRVKSKDRGVRGSREGGSGEGAALLLVRAWGFSLVSHPMAQTCRTIAQCGTRLRW